MCSAAVRVRNVECHENNYKFHVPLHSGNAKETEEMREFSIGAGIKSSTRCDVTAAPYPLLPLSPFPLYFLNPQKRGIYWNHTARKRERERSLYTQLRLIGREIGFGRNPATRKGEGRHSRFSGVQPSPSRPLTLLWTFRCGL